MRQFTGSCSPEQLHTLQSVFDLIWMELRASSTSSYSGPADPESMREEIARRVLSHYAGDWPDPKEITQQVLASFGFDLHRWRQPHGVGVPSEATRH